MKRYTEKELEELINILKNDGIISVPTDTIYGICGRADSLKAYEKIMKIKNRPENKFLPIMCADKEQIKNIAIVNKSALKLIDAFMPGPITLILNKKTETYIKNGGTKNIPNVAVRMATSRTLKELITKVGIPIFMTSANKSGEPVCKNLDEIERKCPDLDGMLEGNVLFDKQSTIIDCTLDILKIKREGVITIEEIDNVLKDKP